MNFCPECGTKQLNNAKFCSHCGYDIIKGAANEGEKFSSLKIQIPKELPKKMMNMKPVSRVLYIILTILAIMVAENLTRHIEWGGYLEGAVKYTFYMVVLQLGVFILQLKFKSAFSSFAIIPIIVVSFNLIAMIPMTYDYIEWARYQGYNTAAILQEDLQFITILTFVYIFVIAMNIAALVLGKKKRVKNNELIEGKEKYALPKV